MKIDDVSLKAYIKILEIKIMMFYIRVFVFKTHVRDNSFVASGLFFYFRNKMSLGLIKYRRNYRIICYNSCKFISYIKKNCVIKSLLILKNLCYEITAFYIYKKKGHINMTYII